MELLPKKKNGVVFIFHGQNGQKFEPIRSFDEHTKFFRLKFHRIQVLVTPFFSELDSIHPDRYVDLFFSSTGGTTYSAAITKLLVGQRVAI